MFFIGNKTKESLIVNSNKEIDSIKEQYFGKIKPLVECESYFAKAVELKDGKSGDILAVLNKAESILSKLFGAEIIFAIDNSNSLDAYTFVHKDDDTEVEFSSGYKFKTPNNYTIFICLTRPMFYTMSPAELMAITLHEIGHHFGSKAKLIGNISSKPVENYVAGMIEIQKAAKIVTNNGTKPVKESVIHEFFQLAAITVSSFIVIRTIINIVSFLATVDRTDIITIFERLKNEKFTRDILKREDSLFKEFINVMGYNSEEEMADSFATIYGYGENLISAITKIDDDSSIKRETISITIGLLTSWLFSFSLPLTLVLLWLCPTTAIDSSKRAFAQLNTLRKELDKLDMNSKKRKLILKDIDAIEKCYGDYINENKINKLSSEGLYNTLLWKVATSDKLDAIKNSNSLSYKQLASLIKDANN